MPNNKEEKQIAQLFKRLFEEQDKPLSIASLYLLSDLEPELFADFIGRWPHLPAERRETIAQHLADISEENFSVDFSPYFAHFLHDPADKVRKAALDGLWDSSNIHLIDPIIEVMKNDHSVEIRALAAASLGHYILMAEWEELPRHISKPIVTALLEQWDTPHQHPNLRRATLESLAGSGHKRVNTLIEQAYEENDHFMTISAIFAMGRTADAKWVPLLVEELENPENDIRQEAAQALGGIGSPDAVSPLVDFVYSEEDEEAQIVGIMALGQIGGDEATMALTRMGEAFEDEALQEAIENAMDEMSWVGNELALLDYDGEDDEEEEEGEDGPYA